MADFAAAREAMETGIADTSPEATRDSGTGGSGSAERQQQAEVAQAMAELDKMDRFKFDGQEWTPKDLKAAVMRMKDYTQKTQGLSEDRKSFASEQKFYQNLAWDLVRLRDNPSRIQEFISLYPQKFHDIAEKFLQSNQPATQQAQAQTQQQQPQIPIQFLSRMDRIEKVMNDQEVAKNETQINQIVESLSQKYPNAANFKEMVLGRAYEAHTQGTQLNPQVWEDIFKQVDGQLIR